MDGSMMLNYMNMGLGQPDPSMIPQQGFAGPMVSGGLALHNPGFRSGAVPGEIDPLTGLPINPAMSLPPIAGPDASLTGWDGVNDKMRYFAQMQQNRMMHRSMQGAQPGGVSGKGGGGGGFGQLVHSLFGGGGGGIGSRMAAR